MINNHEQKHQRLEKYLVEAVQALPAAASYSGSRVFYLNREWYSDGTRWVTTQEYVLNILPEIAPPFAAATTSFTNIIPEYSSNGGWLVYDAWVAFKPNTVIQSAVNFYTATANVVNASTGAVAGLTLSGGVTDTKTFNAINRWWPMRLGIVPFYLANTYSEFNVNLVPSGAPGTFNATVALLYRLAG
jgi:hypothetical protein